MRPGISFSASSISLRPKAARERSATLNLDAGADIIVEGDSIGYVEDVCFLDGGEVVIVFGRKKDVEGKFYEGEGQRAGKDASQGTGMVGGGPEVGTRLDKILNPEFKKAKLRGGSEKDHNIMSGN